MSWFGLLIFHTYVFVPVIPPSQFFLIHNDHLPLPHLCCISRGSFCFLLWSTGDWELMLRDGGVPSLICSLPPSGSVLPRSVFLHFARRFWNQTCMEIKKECDVAKWLSTCNSAAFPDTCIHFIYSVQSCINARFWCFPVCCICFV